jgi:hypothetical protein
MSKRKNSKGRTGCISLVLAPLKLLFSVTVSLVRWLNSQKVTLPIRGGMTFSLLGILVILGLLCVCCSVVYTGVDTGLRQAGLLPTYTPVPTNTPRPTETPRPTATPLLTNTPRPTDTPQATVKPEPSPIPATATSVTAYVVAGADGVNLRSGPGTNYTRLGYLDPGTEAHVTGCYGDWWQIEHDGARCWVYGEIVDAFNTEDVSQVEPPPSPAPAPATATPVSTEPPAATAAPILPTDTPQPTEPVPPPRDYLAAGVWRCPNSTEGAAYVGSINSDKFHFTRCSYAIKIEPGNRICFESREAALNYNYIPCGRCQP